MENGSRGKRFAEWGSQLRSDVDATLALVKDEAIARPGRRYLAGALNYLLQQLDLIPDHEKAGAIDDAFVVRIAAGLAAEHASSVGTQQAAVIGRLSNEEEEIRGFLGDPLFAKLRRYVVELADKSVRGRTTDIILNDPKARAELERELEQSLKRMKNPALEGSDPAALETEVMSYLNMKLK